MNNWTYLAVNCGNNLLSINIFYTHTVFAEFYHRITYGGMQKLGMLTSSPTCLKMTENSCPLIGHWFLSMYLQLAVVGNSTWREGCFAAPIKPCFDETILECRQVWLLFRLLLFYSWCISSEDLDQNQEGAALWGGGQCTLLGGVDLTAPGTSGIFLTLLPSWVKHHGEAAFVRVDAKKLRLGCESLSQTTF